MKAIMTKEKRQKNLHTQFGLNLENKASLLTQGALGCLPEGFNYRFLPPTPPKK
ncbi:MAG: hypothetical protein JSS34_06995 [Proteobacteria bacterium]|nr:hypothetical protein [Pseudomonadota bacterium]